MINGLSDKEAQYIKSTWKNLQDELVKAINVLENENELQEELDISYNNLLRVYLQLRLKPSKDVLEDLINRVESLDSSQYTVASFREVEKSLENAKKVIADENATEKEIEKAQEDLKTAMNNLKTNSSNSDNSTSSNNSNNVGSSSNSGKLPQTGGTSAVMVLLVAAVVIVAGYFMVKKSKKQ
ncbi:LPXTG cell wall anchor domain-containing protein [Clostridium sp.]|uniref:LPXTG cell wall anchor domain-containing protein n=1 Tax=Clostridium sp. TaxID=1506 RepID=UPI00260ADCFD|nr:LPXTG cell wall anchor domain-containing protein [Clostridium sp.]